MLIKLLQEPSIARYLDTAAHVVTARHVLLMTVKFEVVAVARKPVLFIRNTPFSEIGPLFVFDDE